MSEEMIETEIADASPVLDSETVDSKYLEDLKKDNIKWRTRAKENRDAAKKFEEVESRLKETESKAELAMKQASEHRALADRRLIDAEIKSVATELGLKKLEYAKLADLNQVKLTDSGDVQGVREMLLNLKAQDPDLFKLPTTSNTSFSPQEIKPVVQSNNLSDVKTMSDFNRAKEEWLQSLS